MQTISPQDLQGRIGGTDEWALFDIREAGEADAGHIFGASFLPRRMLELKLPELVPGRDTALYFYDEGGDRAARAAASAELAGYRNTFVLDGGLPAWEGAGLPVVSGSNVPSKLFGEEVYEHEGVSQLPVAELHRWQSEGRPHVVCDIRTPDEYVVGRIPQALGAFGADVGTNARDLAARDVPIVVHCAGRTRSIIAAQTLRVLGVSNVHALENGTMGWQLAGYELEREPSDRVLKPSAASAADFEARAKTLATAQGAAAVDASELATWLDRRAAGSMNLYFFDVRQVARFDEGHIPGARTLPGGLAVQRTDEFVSVRNAPIVLVDDAEGRAWMTAYWLRRMQFPRVYVLSGGLDGWRAAGGTVEQGRPRVAPLRLDEVRAEVPRVAAAELHAELGSASPPVVVDVDTSRYFAETHVPGAHWVPYGGLESRIGTLVAGREAPIVVTCHNGLHSTYAAANLRRLGYTAARVLAGGSGQYAKAGFAVDKGLDDPAPNDIVTPPYAKDKATMARYLEWEQKLTRGEAGPGH